MQLWTLVRTYEAGWARLLRITLFCAARGVVGLYFRADCFNMPVFLVLLPSLVALFCSGRTAQRFLSLLASERFWVWLSSFPVSSLSVSCSPLQLSFRLWEPGSWQQAGFSGHKSYSTPPSWCDLVPLMCLTMASSRLGRGATPFLLVCSPLSLSSSPLDHRLPSLITVVSFPPPAPIVIPSLLEIRRRCHHRSCT